MILTKEQALKLHHEMWTDMQKDLGNCPSYGERVIYKKRWCSSHFPNEYICAYCFLCEYDEFFYGKCNHCPINWGTSVYRGCANNEVTYHSSPISEILALPERNTND